MDSYVVIRPFVDLQDKNYRYYVGDTFPRSGYSVTKERVYELSSDKNRLNLPLIKKVDVVATSPIPVVSADEQKKAEEKQEPKQEQKPKTTRRKTTSKSEPAKKAGRPRKTKTTEPKETKETK